MFSFTKLLLNWFHSSTRELPWKKDTDAYSIWLSEIIMQQTQVAYGSQYYLKFKSLFPTVFELSNAKLEKILKAWEGLGYYSRARNLHKTAQTVANKLDGKFPETAKELEKLSGVGPYTAAAIASFAFDEQIAALDGNAFRVLSRVFEIDTPIDSAKGKNEFQTLANSLIENSRAADFNQAIMDFGATVCRPKNPDCSECALATICESRRKQTMLDYPVKKAKVTVKNRYFNYIIFQVGDEFFIRERLNNKDVWQNLFEFYLLETDKKQDIGIFSDLKLLDNVPNEQVKIVKNWEEKQRLSHQFIHGQMIWIKLDSKPERMGKKGQWVKSSDLANFPFPKLLQNVLKNIVT